MNERVIQRAEKIVASLVGSNKNEAIAILSASLFMIVKGEAPLKTKLESFDYGANPNLIRRSRHQIGKIDRDLELKQYIIGFNGYLTISEWNQELVKRFGKKRAPSKSTIHRFLQKIEKQVVSSLDGQQSVEPVGMVSTNE